MCPFLFIYCFLFQYDVPFLVFIILCFFSILGHLELFDAVGPSGAIWCDPIWAVGKPSRLQSSPGSTLERPPALVKQLPRIMIACGHLGTSGIIWSHLEISGPSGASWSRHNIFANPKPATGRRTDIQIRREHIAFHTLWKHRGEGDHLITKSRVSLDARIAERQPRYLSLST